MLDSSLLIQFKVNLIMEESQARKRKCERCNRRIVLSRYELHLTKCKPKEPKPTKKEAREARKREEEAARAALENSPPEEPEEKIPCYNCGYQQTLAELDTHPLRCPNRELTCPSCRQKYPLSIIGNHRDVCPRRPQQEEQSPPQPPTSNAAMFRVPPQSRPGIIWRVDLPNNAASSQSIFNARPENTRNQAGRSETILSVPSRSQDAVVPGSASSSEQPSNNSRNGPPPPSRSQNTFFAPPAGSRGERANIFSSTSESNQPNIFRSRPAEEASSNASQRPPRPRVQRTRINDQVEVIERQAARHRMVEEVSRLMAAQEMASRSAAHLARQLAARHQTKPEQGLSKSLIKLIPERRFKPREDGEEELCAICCTEFEKQDYVKDLRCKHDFHVKCLTDWLCINSSCPLCKCDLAMDIKEKEKNRSKQKSKRHRVHAQPSSLMTFQAFLANSNWDEDSDDGDQ